MAKEATKIRGIYEKVPGSGIWWIRYADANGRIRREKAGTKSAAIKLLAKRKTEVLQGKKLPEQLRRNRATFPELLKDALEYSKIHKRSHGDDVQRGSVLKEWLGERPAESIQPQEIERWLSSNNWKPATQNRYRALLLLIYRLGIQNGKVAASPAKLVRQRRENNARIRFLESSEEESLRKVMLENYSQHLPELDLALNTGMRLSEQYGLTWDAVDFDRSILTIPRSKHGEMRHVPLNSTAVAALRTAQEVSNGQPWVFLNCYGERLQRPRKWFEAAIKAAKITGFTWHCLRHTFASRLVMAGVDIRTVQELMGHKTIGMTVRYAHLAPKHQLAAVERLCDTGTALDRPTDTKTSTSPEGQSVATAARPN